MTSFHVICFFLKTIVLSLDWHRSKKCSLGIAINTLSSGEGNARCELALKQPKRVAVTGRYLIIYCLGGRGGRRILVSRLPPAELTKWSFGRPPTVDHSAKRYFGSGRITSQSLIVLQLLTTHLRSRGSKATSNNFGSWRIECQRLVEFEGPCKCYKCVSIKCT